MSVGIVCLLCFSNISWSMHDSTLAIPSRFRPFFVQHGLDFRNITSVFYASIRLKQLIAAKTIRETHIIKLNGLFPNDEVEIENGIKTGYLNCTGKEYLYAIFHFKKENKDINVLFFNDHEVLTDAELQELGIMTDEDKLYFLSPESKGIWLKKPTPKIRVIHSDPTIATTIPLTDVHDSAQLKDFDMITGYVKHRHSEEVVGNKEADMRRIDNRPGEWRYVQTSFTELHRLFRTLFSKKFIKQEFPELLNKRVRMCLRQHFLRAVEHPVYGLLSRRIRTNNLFSVIVSMALQHPQKKVTILEWGVGDGTALISIGHKLKAMGIDNVRLVGFANMFFENWHSAPDNVDFIFDTAGNLPLYFEAGEIDMVFSHLGLNLAHLGGQKLAKHLAGLRNKLSDNGCIIFDTGDVNMEIDVNNRIITPLSDIYDIQTASSKETFGRIVFLRPKQAFSDKAAAITTVTTVRNNIDQVHSENRNHPPDIPDKTILCHIVTDSIVPDAQKGMLKRLEQDMRGKDNYIERVVTLSVKDATDQEEFLRELERIKAREETRYQEKGYTVQFDVACPSIDLVARTQDKFGIQALAFARGSEGDIVQIEGIILALRTLRTGNVKDLLRVYKLLIGKELKTDISDIEKLAKTILFVLPVTKLDVDEIDKINTLIEKNIKNAA